ncbi:pentatricopeptide repeat-containing protein [Pyrus ussuriensis x Pyrus communis]|uniref:Pentatricopeptide repeat-containing protein n=1 Tax=Pyrus ussuriensis x Pyrus communis TaxID=2448454 RepID=A0A5N5F332_9ROSA|nr:pentatricopeptide repeat-containing protein [Pyrus ussuriensis x Pyrus communis]
MIHILTEHTPFKPAHQLLEKIALKNFLSSPSVLNVCWLVIFYANSKMTQGAIQVLGHMRVHGFKPHLHAFTVLLSSLVKHRLTNMVWKLIHACCKSGGVEKAESLLSEMEFKCALPDLFTYNTLISLYSKRGMHYEALSVRDRMERARVGRMREAVRLFREIKGATPNHITYTTFIDGYCRVNDLEESLRLCEVMKAKELYPGVVTYNSILRKLYEESRMRDVNKLLNEMGERNVEPDNVTCNTLINAYCKIRDMRTGVNVKDRIYFICHAMLDVGIYPSTYTWIIDGYCNQENEAVIRLPDEFSRKGLCADVSAYRALIRRLCKQERVDSAEKVFSLRREKGISGDCNIH